jgi:hypothetical protein
MADTIAHAPFFIRANYSDAMAAGNDFVDPCVGLCAGCRHVEIVRSARSIFYMCRRSFTDPGFPKYPALPVISCIGFEPKDADGDDDVLAPH